MKLWDGSYLSTKGVRHIELMPWAVGTMFVRVLYEDGRRVSTFANSTTDPAIVEQIEAFAKEAGL